jgi:hypothetical protein
MQTREKSGENYAGGSTIIRRIGTGWGKVYRIEDTIT